MALRKILTDGDPALHKMCRPVTSFDARLHTLLDDLKETLADANGAGSQLFPLATGAGLAAPQVGILRRVVIVVDAEDNMLELVNPEILTQEGEQEGFEGCLSVPGRWGVVKRPYKVRVRAQDRNGNFFEAEGEEIVARCFCHEIEHLDGHLFTEHADRLYTTEELDRMMEEQGE